MTRIVTKTIRYNSRTANKMGAPTGRARTVTDWPATIALAIEADGEFTCSRKNYAAKRSADAMVKRGVLVYCGTARSRFIGDPMQHVYRAA